MQPVRVGYEFTPDDALAAVEYEFWHNPAVRARLRRTYALMTVLTGIMLFGLAATRQTRLEVYIGLGVIWVILIVLFLVGGASLSLRHAIRMLRKHYQRPEVATQFGPVTVDLTDGGILVASPAGEARHHWVTIRQIAATDRHFFIYLPGAMTIAVPRAAFQTNADFDQFTEVAREYLNKADHSADNWKLW